MGSAIASIVFFHVCIVFTKFPRRGCGASGPWKMQGSWENMDLGPCRKYNMAPKHTIQAEANVENISRPMKDVGPPHHGGGRPSPRRGGRLRRPPPCGVSSCGPLVFSAFTSACNFCFGPILYFLLWPHLIFNPFFNQLPFNLGGAGHPLIHCDVNAMMPKTPIPTTTKHAVAEGLGPVRPPKVTVVAGLVRAPNLCWSAPL